MIEKQIISQKLKEKDVEDFVFSSLGKLSCSHVKLQRTPLGEKISVYTSKPGLIVGRKGANIKALTDTLKNRFSMENPQIEVVEITNPFLDASSVARSLIAGFQRFGPKRFKAMAYYALDNTMKAGARGIEIVIAGRGVPGERAKSWRFSAGYLKKSGDISENFMDRCYESCNLRSGTIGIKVSILHPSVLLPDDVSLKKDENIKTAEGKVAESTAEDMEIKQIKDAKKQEGSLEKEAKSADQEEKTAKTKRTRRKPKSEDGENKKE